MKITAVIVSRNDNYGGHLNERATYALNSAINTYDEVIYVDWNSDTHSLLWDIKDNLQLKGNLKHFVIPPHVASQLTNFDPDAQKCCETLGRNIGIRRAEGDYIISTNIDVIHPKREEVEEIIKIAIDFIDSFKSKLDEVTLTDDYPISKDTLEEINREYQLFVEQKLNQLKMVKEFSQKMIKNIEDLQLPCLEKMLSSRFGYISSGKFICEKCNFIGKNPLALSVHKRTCDKTSSSPSETSNVPPMNILLQTPPQQPTIQPVVQIPVQQPAQQLIQPKITKTLVKSVIQVKPDNNK